MEKRIPVLKATSLIFFSVAPLFLVGCSDDAAMVSDLKAIEATEVPFKGTCETTFEVVPIFDPLSGALLSLSIPVEGTCRMTHLGRSTYLVDQTIDCLQNTISFDVTIIAANGDQISGEDFQPGFSCGAFPPTFSFNSTLTFTGGTGRFSEVSGTVPYTVFVNTVESKGIVEYDGYFSF